MPVGYSISSWTTSAASWELWAYRCRSRHTQHVGVEHPWLLHIWQFDLPRIQRTLFPFSSAHSQLSSSETEGRGDQRSRNARLQGTSNRTSRMRILSFMQCSSLLSSQLSERQSLISLWNINSKDSVMCFSIESMCTVMRNRLKKSLSSCTWSHRDAANITSFYKRGNLPCGPWLFSKLSNITSMLRHWVGTSPFTVGRCSTVDVTQHSWSCTFDTAIRSAS